MKRRVRTVYKKSFALLVLAVVLFTYSISVATPVRVAARASQMLGAASASISVGVAPNPDNTLAAQLQDRSLELDKRQAEIERAAREQKPTLAETLGLYSFFISIALFVLIALNFYLDTRRRAASGKKVAGPFSVDLR